MSQFNATQDNAAAARDAQRQADVNKFNAQLVTQVDQFNSQQDFARNQWNAQNAAAVEASNVQWRRQANTINTAAQNQIICRTHRMLLVYNTVSSFLMARIKRSS